VLDKSPQDEKNFPPLLNFLKSTGFGKNTQPLKEDIFWFKEMIANSTGDEKKSFEERETEYFSRLESSGKKDIEFLKSLDSNKDLNITNNAVHYIIKSRLEDSLKERLEVDVNKDNKLTIDEYALVVPQRGEPDEDGYDWHQKRHFKSEDRDGNKSIDKIELLGWEIDQIKQKVLQIYLTQTLFNSDTNKNGKLEFSEFGKEIEKEDREKLWLKVARDEKSVSLERLWPSLHWLSSKEISSLQP